MSGFILFMLALLSFPSLAAEWYQPKAGTTWQWQLQGKLNTQYDVEVYDVDLFDTSIAQIHELQQQGRKVICYFSAGSLESWRNDINLIPPTAIGAPLDDWSDENWLDIRNKQVWRTMQNRLKLAALKDCNGVEPDNVDGYQNSSGFSLTAHDQIRFNRFLAQSAHLLNLSIGLKNSLELVSELVDEFDFAVNEQCLEYQECQLLKPFIEQNKAVFHAEYQQQPNLCQYANSLKFSTLRLPLELNDRFHEACL